MKLIILPLFRGLAELHVKKRPIKDDGKPPRTTGEEG